jgi:hypothetical protein
MRMWLRSVSELTEPMVRAPVVPGIDPPGDPGLNPSMYLRVLIAQRTVPGFPPSAESAALARRVAAARPVTGGARPHRPVTTGLATG